MAGLTDLLLGGAQAGAGFLGDKAIANAQGDAAAVAVGEAKKDRELREQLIKAPRTTGLGDTTGFNAATGGFETTLTPETLALQEAIRGSGTAASEGSIGAIGEAGGLDRQQFIDRQVRDDDRLKNAILNPALRDAAALDQRTLGGTSNAGNITSRFQERILPQIQFGGETQAFNAFGQEQDRLIKNALGLGGFGQGVGQQIVPQPDSLGAVANATNAIPRPVTAPADTGAGLGSSTLASAIQRFAALQQGDANRASSEQLIRDIIGRGGLGNEQAAVSQTTPSITDLLSADPNSLTIG